jgi:hypothetical protein
VLGRWRRKAAGPTAPAVLPGYSTPGWLSRHRKLVLTATFFVLFFYSAFFLLIGRFLIVPFTVPLAILALLIIWALPERDRIPDKALHWFFMAFMVATLFWPNYLALDLGPLPWITASRLFGVPMVLLLLICLSQSPDFRDIIKRSLAASPTITKMMIIFTLLCVLSLGFSTSPSFTANHLIIALVNWIAIFFVSLYVFSKPGNITRFVWLLWAAVLFWCVMGFWEWWYSKVPWAGHIPSFLAVEDEAVQRILTGSARAATGIYRVQGKFTTSLGLAEFMALMTPFLLYFAVDGKKLLVRAAAAITLPIMFWVIVVTDSRLGMVGFLLSLIFYMFFWSTRRWMHDRDSLFGPALTLSYPAVFVLFITATFTIGRLRNMVWGTGANKPSNDARAAQIEMGLADFMSRPWGYGLGRAAETLNYQNLAGVVTIDNYYLSILLELGIIGFIVFYGMFVVAIILGGIRGLREQNSENLWIIPTVISLANFVVIKSVLSSQEIHPLVFALLGIVVTILARPVGLEGKDQDSLPPHPTRQLGQRSDGWVIATR